MLSGDFEAAWRESDLLRVIDPSDPHRLWRGEAIAGKRLMVRCLHGFGDAIQFLRYAALLRRTVDRLIVQVAPQLLPLVKCIEGIGDLVTWDELSYKPGPNWDVQIEVMQLPYLFRTSIDSIPASIRYLTLPDSEVNYAAAAMETLIDLPRIGLCWSCGKWNQSRAIEPQRLEHVVRGTRAHYFSLEQDAVEIPFRLLHPDATWNESCYVGSGPLRLAALIANLDLVITVDTMVAHIAGALGRPVWLLLQHAADWRWMHDTTRSPWYASMRIYRQPKPGDWMSVIEEVSCALRNFDGAPDRSRKQAYAPLG